MTEEQAIDSMRPLIYAFAQHVLAQVAEDCPWLDLDDLAQEGMIGALQAFRSFQDEKDAAFKTHAHYRVKGAIVDAVRKARGAGRTRPQVWKAEKDYEVACWLREQLHQQAAQGYEDGTRSPTFLPRRIDTGALLRAMQQQEDPCREALEASLAQIARTQPREVDVYRQVFQEERMQVDVAHEYGVTIARISQIIRTVVAQIAAAHGVPIPHIRWGQRPKSNKAYPAYKVPALQRARRRKKEFAS